MKIKITLFLLLLFTAHSPAADRYLHVNVGGGYHTLTYPLLNGHQSGGFGGTANFGYSHFFAEEWGLQTCLGIQTFSAKSNLNYTSSAPDVDSDGEAYHFRVNFKNSIEQQQALFLDIPLALQYRHIFTEEIGLMATLGAKVSLPVLASYTTKGSIETSGLYNQYGKDAELFNIPDQDFLTDQHSYSNQIAFKTAFAAVMDLGALYRLSDETDLYAGAYFNYGLNNILNPDTKLIYQRINTYNGVLSSSQVDVVKPLSFGLKIGLYFHLPEYIPAGKSNLVAPKTKVSEIKLAVKLPVNQTQASKVIQRGKVVEAKDILEARRIILVNKQNKEKALANDSLRKVDSILVAKKLEESKTIVSTKTSKATAAPKTKTSVSMPDLDDLIQVGGKKNKRSKAPKSPSIQTQTTVSENRISPKADTTNIQAVIVEPEEIVKPVETVEPKVEAVRNEPVTPVLESTSEPVTDPVNRSEQEEDPFVIAKRIAASFDIKFKFSSDEMVEPDLDKLKALSEILKANGYIRLYLAGHTDNVGSLRANFRLGDKRAAVVKQLFLEDGVLDKNVKTKSKAYLDPKVPNSSEENKALNRRVEMRVEKSGKTPKAQALRQAPKEEESVRPSKENGSSTEFITKVRILFGRNLAQLALKYYGARDFWVYIYQANKDHLSNPDKIPFGTLIRIPKLDSTLIDPNNPDCIEKANALQQKLMEK